MEELAARTVEQFEKIDILVYASGTNTPDRAMAKLSMKSWDEVICVNLNGAYYATRAVLPAMRERKSGHLIYIASISGLVPDLSGAAYQASKRGMLGMAHAIRVEEKENSIRTCVICPGIVDTEILEKRPVKPPAETLAKALQPEDVAEAVLFAAKLPARACRARNAANADACCRKLRVCVERFSTALLLKITPPTAQSRTRRQVSDPSFPPAGYGIDRA